MRPFIASVTSHVSRLGRPFALAVALAALTGCNSDPASPTSDANGDASTSADASAVRAAARPITGVATDYDPLLALVGTDTRLVLLGDATHGTHEFYAERARITDRLIVERGFSGIAVEANWAEAARVNDYVRGIGTDASAEAALASFNDFPEWMWRNTDVRDLVRRLRELNATLPPASRVGFYGMDVQDLFGPIDPVLRYLDATNPTVAARVRTLYACFAQYGGSADQYGLAASSGRSCAIEANLAATELDQLAAVRPADPVAAEAQFAAVRGAHAVASAEAYFRANYAGNTNTWNLRDSLMYQNLQAVMGHLTLATGRSARVAVWAHNTHSGDDRQTQMGESGEQNLGQFARQQYGTAALLTGFFTYTGTVYAAQSWGGAGSVRSVNPALPGSFSSLFHDTGLTAFVLPLRGSAVAERLTQPRLERAIGVLYLPQTERQSHYFTARLGAQFDVAVFFDVTRAVTPLTPGAVGSVAGLSRLEPTRAAMYDR